MSKKKYNLACVAHPDDETIFFGGLLQRKRHGLPWTVVCVTTDGSQKRKNQFHKACELLKIDRPVWYGFPDKYEQRLPIAEITAKLTQLMTPKEIFTHGIIGEYGHPHHQDVCRAIFTAFPAHKKIYSCAYNAYPELRIHLTEKEFKLKTHLLTKIYSSETNRFLNVLPATSDEGFVRLKREEVEKVYHYLTHPKASVKFKKQDYLWLEGYLPHLKDLKRIF